MDPVFLKKIEDLESSLIFGCLFPRMGTLGNFFFVSKKFKS